MQPAASDKTFHLKWNNHLQNLSQLFTTIYSSAALADVTLSCRDGTIKAHKLVLSACSPYFEQIFKENPCKHPVIILKGIPYSEINLLVEFMYKGSVDVQELDLQSLMHTASELEIRGLAYEIRKDASQLLNVNLEYPSYTSTPIVERVYNPGTMSYETTPRNVNAYQTNMERLKQIHLYQQSMCRSTTVTQNQQPTPQPEASAIKRKRKTTEDAMPHTTTNAVKNILAAAAKELAEKKVMSLKDKVTASIQTEDDLIAVKQEMEEYEANRNSVDSKSNDEDGNAHCRDTRFKGKKRVSIIGVQELDSAEQVKLAKKKLKYVIKSGLQPDDHGSSEDGVSKLIITAVTGGETNKSDGGTKGGIKVVQLSALQKRDVMNKHDDSSSDGSDAEGNNMSCKVLNIDDDNDSESTDSKSTNDYPNSDNHDEHRPHKCDQCDLRFTRSSHLARHKVTHTGERPFNCGGCGRSFTRSDKLRLHTKICERDDPTVNLVEESTNEKHPHHDTMMSGMVRITHSERNQLMFTPSGDVMLAPKPTQSLNTSALSLSNNMSINSSAGMMSIGMNSSTGSVGPDGQMLDGKGVKRGRGRPRKTPLPLVPKIKRKRGRPPKMMIDIEASLPIQPIQQQHITPAGHQYIIKRKRGRPPKNFFSRTDGIPGPKENYNATNLPFGDFTYLTDLMYNQPTISEQPSTYHQNITTVDPHQAVDIDLTEPNKRSATIVRTTLVPPMKSLDEELLQHERTIDLSSSSSDEDEPPTSSTKDKQDEMQKSDNGNDNLTDTSTKSAPENAEHVMTVGDCQILKLNPTEESSEKEKASNEEQPPPPPAECEPEQPEGETNIIITTVTTIGDCTIQPIEENT